MARRCLTTHNTPVVLKHLFIFYNVWKETYSLTVRQGMISIGQFSFYRRSDVIFRALIYTFVLSLPENFGFVLDTILFIFRQKGKTLNPLPVTLLFKRSVSTHSLAETSELILFPFFLYQTNKQTNKQIKLSPDKRQTGTQRKLNPKDCFT